MQNNFKKNLQKHSRCFIKIEDMYSRLRGNEEIF